MTHLIKQLGGIIPLPDPQPGIITEPKPVVVAPTVRQVPKQWPTKGDETHTPHTKPNIFVDDDPKWAPPQRSPQPIPGVPGVNEGSK